MTGDEDTGPAEIYEALRRNDGEPYGPPRSARAEKLVELAERCGDAAVLITALNELIQAYEYSAEPGKMFVPFARMLRMWDERPADFDAANAYRLHWKFKWVSSGMLSHPQIPLATIRQWLGEMDRRYRLAAYGPRAVRAAEFDIADHVGDLETARRAYDQWLAADRDEMTDCAACERSAQGDWLASMGRAAEAVERWAAVTHGDLVCQEEPHRVLGKSLLPLVRLGRHDEARANHLRGYRMVRRNLNLQGTVGEHIEFCALTGNEARGLEMLAEHPTWFEAEASPKRRLEFLCGATVLLRRLHALGYAAHVVAGPAQRSWTVADLLAHAERTAAELAGRFDERNGTNAVGDRARARMDQQPLVDALPLGVRATPPAHPESYPVPVTAGRPRVEPSGGPDGVDSLVAEARRLEELGHPRADAAWQHVAEAVADTEVDALLAAQLVDNRGRRVGLDDPLGGRRHLLDAAVRYGALGMAARATVCRARAALALTYGGQGDAAAEELAAALTEIEALATSGVAQHRDVSIVLQCALRASFVALQEARDDQDARARQRSEVDRQIERLAALGERYHAGLAEEVRAHLALNDGDRDAAQKAFWRTVRLFAEADRPWLTVRPNLALAELSLSSGDPAEAERSARAAIAHAGELDDTAIAGHARLLLAQACVQQGRDGDGATSALEAAHRFDAVDQPAAAAHARLLLGRAYRHLGRHAEAAAILEETLPEIATHLHDFDAAQARQTLGRCLADLGEHGAAAEHFLVAAEAAQAWADQTPHAMLASDAAHALAEAGMTGEATRAYARAAQVWRTLGETAALVRTLRATAWHAYQHEDDLDRALELMDEARKELAILDGTAPSGELAFERAETDDQTARLLAGAAASTGHVPDPELAARAHGCALQAADGFRGCGPDRFNDLVAAEILAAEIDADLLGRRDEATRRLHELIAVCDRHGGPEAEQPIAYCRSLLEDLEGADEDRTE